MIIAEKQKGASLIMTFFVMIIILAVVLSISLLLYSEIKVTRNIGISTESLYVAESGVEKVFYYDRQVRPILGEGKTAARGLCSMYLQNTNNLNACISDPTSGNESADHSIYCNNTNPPISATDSSDTLHDPNGCNYDVCDDCKVSFSTTLDGKNNKAYVTTAQISPLADGSFNFQVESKGNFGSIARQVEVISNETKRTQVGAITITNACANPKSNPQGAAIDISAYVTLNVTGASDQIYSVITTIYDSNGNAVAVEPLNLVSGTKIAGSWAYTWPTTTGTMPSDYTVDLEVRDSLTPPFIKSMPNIPYCGQ